MNPVVLTQTGNGSTTYFIPDWRAHPFAIGIGCKITSGTPTYSVQHSLDESFFGTPTKWFEHAVITAKTTDTDSNYAFPCQAIRLTITGGGGTVVATFIQAVGYAG